MGVLIIWGSPPMLTLSASQLEGDEIKFYLMIQEISGGSEDQAQRVTFSVTGVSALGRSEQALLGEPSAHRVMHSISDTAALAVSHFFGAERSGDGANALARLVRWCEYYAAGSLCVAG
jgi:hypothetical protein